MQESKPRVFIGSSRESVGLASALQEILDDRISEATVWTQGVFGLSLTTIEGLEEELAEADFAVFVVSPDDHVRIRQTEYGAWRDNVLFELGLFMGHLGRRRVFLVQPSGQTDMRIPTDLLGVTAATYDARRATKSPVAALGIAANKIIREIEHNALEIRDPSGERLRPSAHTPDSELLLDGLVNSVLETVCRAMTLPIDRHINDVRAFMFRRSGPHLICSHYWALNPVREIVDVLRFEINEATAARVAVVDAFLREQVVAREVNPLPEAVDTGGSAIANELTYVLAAPLHHPGRELWGTVNFDASTEEARRLLESTPAKSAIFRLSQHIDLALALRTSHRA